MAAEAAVDLDFDISGRGTEDAPAEIAWDITSDDPAEISRDVTGGDEADLPSSFSGVCGTLTDIAFRNNTINDLIELQAFLQQVRCSVASVRCAYVCAYTALCGVRFGDKCCLSQPVPRSSW